MYINLHVRVKESGDSFFHFSSLYFSKNVFFFFG